MPTDSEAQHTLGRVTEDEIQERHKKLEPIRQALRDIQESDAEGSIADKFRETFWQKIGLEPTPHPTLPTRPTIKEPIQDTIQEEVTKQ